MPCINMSNKRYFKRETLWRTKFGVSSAPSFVQLSYFYKFCKNELPYYIFKLIPVRSSEYFTRSMQNVPFFKRRHNFFKKIFFLSAIMQWNNLDLVIRNSTSLNIFRNSILKFIRPSTYNVPNSHNPKAIEFITRLVLALITCENTISSIVFNIY